jgi:hypothetical protein
MSNELNQSQSTKPATYGNPYVPQQQPQSQQQSYGTTNNTTINSMTYGQHIGGPPTNNTPTNNTTSSTVPTVVAAYHGVPVSNVPTSTYGTNYQPAPTSNPTLSNYPAVSPGYYPGIPAVPTPASNPYVNNQPAINGSQLPSTTQPYPNANAAPTQPTPQQLTTQPSYGYQYNSNAYAVNPPAVSQPPTTITPPINNNNNNNNAQFNYPPQSYPNISIPVQQQQPPTGQPQVSSVEFEAMVSFFRMII